ncbi:MAG: ADP-glyceromanno-heptose 6-epimerase [Opitutales bacterium]|nr:ADP-glyceromanno-heptose 6-epimerase [Opitutales bacterium]
MHDLGKGITVVTGGAGLIGSAVIWGLNQKGFQNILLVDEDNPSAPKKKNLENLSFHRQLNPKNFRELVRCKSQDLQDIHTIIHLGACSSTTETNVDYLNDNNLGYTQDLCEFSIESNVRFVYASSAATYGDGSHGMSDQEPDIRKLQPLNLYGWSKHKFDLIAKERSWDDHIAGLKYFNVFGPNEEHKGHMRSVVSKAYQQICETGKMTLFKSHHPDYEDGKQMRDFLYVKDAVKMTIWLASDEQVNGLFNLGSGQARTWLDLGYSIFKAINQNPNIEFLDMPEILREKYQYFTEANIQKIRSAGYNQPLLSLEQGVMDYVQQYLQKGERLGA